MAIAAGLRERADRLKRETFALYLAARHPGTPWHAKAVVALVAGYAFSPVDLIPDFIPVLGYLDELVILPLGIALALRLVPAPVMAECRESADAAFESERPVSRTAAAVIMAVWLLLAVSGAAWAWLALR